MNDPTPVRAVNCTQCGAPLKLHGGHRVRSLSCGSCGSVLDTKDEYQVVKQFADIQRPQMPLELGMQGKLKGIAFTIIGVVQYRDSEGYSWFEYQIFSPTHGYHWLVFSEGHFVFSRRVREIVDLSLIQKTTFKAKGMTFKVYESYEASVYFVEGELTYVAEVGNRVAVTEGICPPYNFSRERSDTEEEFQFGEYLDPSEVYRAFGIDEIPRSPRSVHACQPYIAKPSSVSFSRMARWFAIPTVIIAIAIAMFGGGSNLLDRQFNAQQMFDGTYSDEFTVSGVDSAMALKLSSNVSNAWSWYDISIVKGEHPIATLSKGISYYHGVEGGESWREGSQSTQAYFTLADPGTYRFYIEGTGGTGERGSKPQNKGVRFQLYEDVIVSRYFFILALICIVAALWEPIVRYRFEAKRWAPVLEDDDE